MKTQQASFAITGMFCAKCAVTIEHALAQVEGVIAAQVNFTTERATVVYDPGRAALSEMVCAVQGEDFDVPLTCIVFYADDLFYATSARTVERVLSRLNGIVQVKADLRTQRIVLDVFPGQVTRADYERELATLGLCVLERPAPNAAREFIVRTAAAATLAALALASAGAHANWFNVGALHSPLVVMVISVLVAIEVGWRFYRLSYDTFVHGERDASVVVALIALILFFGGIPLALTASAAWFSESALVLATLLTAGWFLARATTLGVSRVPHLNPVRTTHTRQKLNWE